MDSDDREWLHTLARLAGEIFFGSQPGNRNLTSSPPPPPPIPVCALRWGSNRRPRPGGVKTNPPPPIAQSPNTPLLRSGNNTSASTEEAATSGDFAGPEPSCSNPNVVALIVEGSCSSPIFKEEPKKKMSKKRKLDDLKEEEKSLMFERSKLQKKIEVMQRFLEELKCRNDGLKKQVMMLPSSVSKCFDLPDLNPPFPNTELCLCSWRYA